MTRNRGTMARLVICILFVVAVSAKSADTKSRPNKKVAARPKSPAERVKLSPVAVEDDPAPEGSQTDVLDQYAQLAAGMDEKEEAKEVLIYHCKHVTGRNLKKALENFLSPAGVVADSSEADIVIVSDVKSNIGILKTIANGIDMPVPQILVEARVIEFTVDNLFEKEVNVAMQHFKDLDQISGLPSNYMDFVKRLTDSFVPAGTSPANTQGSLAWSQYDAKNQNLSRSSSSFLKPAVAPESSPHPI
jgi:hypothetical protein